MFCDSENLYIIAEIGSNFRLSDTEDWDRSLARAATMINTAAKTGADAVKFQVWTERDLYGLGKDEYTWALPHDCVKGLYAVAQEAELDFILSVFNPRKLEGLVEYCDAIKIASSDFPDGEIWDVALESKLALIASLGAVSRADAFTRMDILQRMEDAMPEIAYLECVAAYPAKIVDYDLKLIAEIAHWNNVTAGVSVHCSPAIAYAALPIGAKVFEFHFGIEESRNTPDACVSLLPGEFSRVCRELRDLDASLRTAHPGWSAQEQDFVLRHRKRVVATKDISTGDKLVYGKNYGFYRTKEPDSIGMVCSPLGDVTALRDFKAGQGIGHIGGELGFK